MNYNPPPQQPPQGYGPPPQQPPQGYGPPPPPGYGPPQGMPGAPLPKGMAIASLILGIVSLVICFIWYVSIPCGVVAIILGAISISKCNKGEAAGKGMATAGLVLGIIGVVLIGILVIIGVSALSYFKSNPQALEQLQQQGR
jgi:hypothetical protein